MRKNIIRAILLLAAIPLVLGGIFLVTFANELRSLASFREVDAYGMYQMTYYGDYGFDEFLKVGAGSDEEIEAFVTNRLLKGMPIDLAVTSGGCSAFVVPGENGEILFGRNFDFGYSPSMQVFTDPDNGYASISTVNLSFLRYDAENLPEGMTVADLKLLIAPYLAFDGMNEKGVAITPLQVPEASLDFAEDKITLNTTTAVRLVLDKAASVDEAVALLEEYNVYFSGGLYCHYLIGDSSGRSVIVEYYDGEMQVIETDAKYQAATNFIAYNGLNIGLGGDEFERYDRVLQVIMENNGVLNESQAVELLADVGIRDEKEDYLQWSVVYNLTSGDSILFAHRNTENLLRSRLEMTS